ncbi:MAG: hypothetical protein G3M78_02930 [Candidatus Nitrohelix vancouverensis]|uniref:Flagellar assembly protein T C-terminal domain-containing protein n=1 Tax=Candidatus Nitrohelix vancouverensis TaxID=2705534 RepID=A0A7T0C0R0_9BACT|nr:MAG: hypothetical protein G3M78_02930 [Candidatus Nitrohelix vancouverensis]
MRLSVLIVAAFVFSGLGACAPVSEQMSESQPLGSLELLSPDSGSVGEVSPAEPELATDRRVGRTIELPKLSISKDKIEQAGFIQDEKNWGGSIVKILNGNLLATENQVVYINEGLDKGVKTGDQFDVFTQERVIYDPYNAPDDSEPAIDISSFDYWGQKRNSEGRELGQASDMLFQGEKRALGVMVKILGQLEVIEAMDNYSRALITRSYGDIEVGDLIQPYEAMNISEIVAGSEPKSIEGNIVALKEERTSAIMGDVVFLNCGSKQSVAKGDLFEAYIIPTIKEHNSPHAETLATFPPYVVGRMQVVTVRKNNSTAVVTYSEKDMPVGQQVRYLPKP